LAFSLSSRLGDALDHGKLDLSIDLFPDRDAPALDKALQTELARLGRGRYHTLLSHLLPRSLAAVMPEITDIPGDQPLHQFSAAQRQRLLERLKRLELTVTGTAPARQGMVTLGGIRCTEVDPRTLASRIVPGLYLAGELLDVAGADSGGYNLQIAFTTGYVAGEAAARAILSADE
jgi:predicted Rossmann fold flavoprotein